MSLFFDVDFSFDVENRIEETQVVSVSFTLSRSSFLASRNACSAGVSQHLSQSLELKKEEAQDNARERRKETKKKGNMANERTKLVDRERERDRKLLTTSLAATSRARRPSDSEGIPPSVVTLGDRLRQPLLALELLLTPLTPGPGKTRRTATSSHRRNA